MSICRFEAVTKQLQDSVDRLATAAASRSIVIVTGVDDDPIQTCLDQTGWAPPSLGGPKPWISD